MIGTEQAKVESAVLLANASFYRAFSQGDARAMNTLWAKRAPVTCLHPGAPLLSGHEAVLGSWRQILRGGGGMELRCDSPSVRVFGEVAIVQCYEAGEGQPAHLAATNAFVLEDGAWRMVHHARGALRGGRIVFGERLVGERGDERRVAGRGRANRDRRLRARAHSPALAQIRASIGKAGAGAGVC